MTTHYTSAEVDAVHEFAWHNRDGVAGSGSQRGAMQLLDKITPAIAARALRELESEMRAEADQMGAHAAILWRATGKRLRARADEIEATS